MPAPPLIATEFTPLASFSGGLLIGLSGVLVLLLNGKIAGLSGVIARLMNGVPGDTAWRAVFLAGLVGGTAAAFLTWGPAGAFELEAGWPRIVAAGFLVGVGTRVGGGCASGHGVCGIARGSRPSLAATLTFLAAGFATVFLARHLLAGGGLS